MPITNNNCAANGSVCTHDSQELSHWLALNRVPGIGAVTFHQLIKHFSSASQLFSASTEQLRACGLSANNIRGLRQPDWPAVEKTLDWAEKPDNTLLTSNCANYPTLLKELSDSPPVLFVQGDADYLSQPQLAIVGSRKPSLGGKQTAEKFASTLASYGLTITSGLAYGIDSAAHHGALQSNSGTIAVLGSGLDNIYPRRHAGLAKKIKASGALVSEHPPETEPLAHHFPRRNRIISGLSIATLVIEASEKSGSLITARLALEQGRDVMAVPGAINNPMARGCHQLIQEGAALVTNEQDVVAGLNYFMLPKVTQNPPNERKHVEKLEASQYKVLYYVDYAPTSIDQIVAKSGLTAAAVSSILLALELLGHVASAPGGMVYRLDK